PSAGGAAPRVAPGGGGSHALFGVLGHDSVGLLYLVHRAGLVRGTHPGSRTTSPGRPRSAAARAARAPRLVRFGGRGAVRALLARRPAGKALARSGPRVTRP